MAITKVNPGSWGVNSLLTSTQANAFDTKIVTALDKSSAGDQLGGVVNFGTGGQIIANTNGGAANGFTGCITATTANAIQSASAQGITAQVAGSIASNTANGIRADVFHGIAGNIAGGIYASAATGITTTVAGGIDSGVAGGINLGGGATDWPTFPARTRTAARPLQMLGTLSAGWTSALSTSWFLVGPATSTLQYLQLPAMPENATLNWIEVRLISSTHTPTVYPGLLLRRHDIAVGQNAVGVDLSTTSLQAMTSLSGALIQACRYTCNQNNVIDPSHFQYVLALQDENGSGSAAGNVFVGVVVNYTVTDLRWGG